MRVAATIVGRRARKPVFLFFIALVVYGGMEVEASSSLEARVHGFAGKIERSILRHSEGRRPKTLLLAANSFTDGLAASIIVRRLASSQLVDFEEHNTSGEVLGQLRQAVEVAKGKSPEVQNELFRRIQQRLDRAGYDFWVFLIDNSDVDSARFEAHILRGDVGCGGECFSTADYIADAFSLSVVRAERAAVELGAGAIHRTLDQTTFGLRSGGVLDRFPNSAEVGQAVVFGSVEMPRLLVEGALIQGDNFSAVNDPNLSGEQREVSVGVQGLAAHGKRVGLLLGGAYRDIKEEVVDDRFNAEASARYAFSDASLGITFGNLVNGVTLRGFGLYSKAEDTSPGITFFSLPGEMWEDSGYGAEIRARRTTRAWGLDFRARKFLATREFNQGYFPGLSKADIEGVGFRVEVRKRWNSFGLGAVWSRSELEFADTPPVAPEARLVAEQKDSFIGLNMSFRWHPD